MANKKQSSKKPSKLVKATKPAAKESTIKSTKSATPKMASKQVKKVDPKPAVKKSAARTAGNKVGAMGYSARIKLPNGKIKVAAASGLWDSEDCPSAIIMKSKEQAMIVAKNLATAYGKGAKPSVSQVKK